MSILGIDGTPAGTEPSLEPEPERPFWSRVARGTAVALVLGLSVQGTGGAQAPTPPVRSPGDRALAFQGPPPRLGGFGRGMDQDVAVVEQFDRDGNGRLDSAERVAAREWLTAGGTQQRGRRGRFGFGGGAGSQSAGSPTQLAPETVRHYGNAPLYDLATLRTLFLTFESDDWEQELATFYGTDVDVPARIVVDGKAYPDVGVHFRGNSSYRMVSDGAKRSLNLAFDFADEDQSLLGYRTVNLLNANGDPSLLRGVLYAEIARQFLPAPKMNWVRVVINGEYWGVYVSAQQFNKDFLREHYDTTEGARWKVPGRPNGRAGMEYLGDDHAVYKRLYEIKTKDSDKSWNALVAMFRVLNTTPLERLEAELSPLLDIDGVLRFLALEVALVNSDGYWTRASDYSLYLGEDGRFRVIPYDINEALMDEGRGRFGPGGFGRGGGVDLDPLVGLDDETKPLRSRLLAIPALRERYLGYVNEVATRWLDWDTLGPRVEQWRGLIADDVRLDTRKLYSTQAFEESIDGPRESLREFIEERRAFLLAWRP